MKIWYPKEKMLKDSTYTNYDPRRTWIIGIGLFLSISCASYYAYRVSLISRLSKIDVASMLGQAKYLPVGFHVGDIKNIQPDQYVQFVQGKKQEILSSDGSHVGEIRVYLFSSEREKDKLFKLLILEKTQEDLIPHVFKGFGECEGCVVSAATNNLAFIVFTRCTALGYLELSVNDPLNKYGDDYFINHAYRLDEQIKSIVCN